jgi:hypothetical protein
MPVTRVLRYALTVLCALPASLVAQGAPAALPVTVTLNVPRLLTIGAAVGSVQVIGEARTSVEISASDSAPTVITYPIGDSLHLSIPAGAPGVSPRVVLRVPLGLRVRAQVSGATLRIDGTRARVELRPISGRVTVRDALEVASDGIAGTLDVDRVASGVSIRTVSAPVTLAGVAGDIEVVSASGTVTIRDARGASSDVRTTSGRVRWSGVMDPIGRYVFRSASGPVSLLLPRTMRVVGSVQHRRSRVELGADVTELTRAPSPRGGETITWTTASATDRVSATSITITTTTGAVRIGRGTGAASSTDRPVRAIPAKPSP